jgi:hypothetical protein
VSLLQYHRGRGYCSPHAYTPEAGLFFPFPLVLDEMMCVIDERALFYVFRLRLGLGMRYASRPSSSVKWCVLCFLSRSVTVCVQRCVGARRRRRLHMRLTCSYRSMADWLTMQNDAFAETSGILAGTFRRMNNMAERQGCRWLWYIIFIILVFWFFIVVWWFRR